jgi:hypothetical protein
MFETRQISYIDADDKAVDSVTLYNGEALALTVKFTNTGDKSVSLAKDAAKYTILKEDGTEQKAATSLHDSKAYTVLPGKTITFEDKVEDSSLAKGKYTVLVTIPVSAEETIESTIEVEVVKSNDATLSDLTVGGTTVADFDPDTTEYTVRLAEGTTGAPTASETVAATENHTDATAVVTQATKLDGTLAERTATVKVTAEDGTVKTYTVVFVVNNKPEIDAGIADVTANAADGNVVIDLSDAYKDADGDELTYTFVSITSNGSDVQSVVINGTDLIIVPSATVNGDTETVTIKVSDGVTADDVTVTFNVTFN